MTGTHSGRPTRHRACGAHGWNLSETTAHTGTQRKIIKAEGEKYTIYHSSVFFMCTSACTESTERKGEIAEKVGFAVYKPFRSRVEHQVNFLALPLTWFPRFCMCMHLFWTVPFPCLLGSELFLSGVEWDMSFA